MMPTLESRDISALLPAFAVNSSTDRRGVLTWEVVALILCSSVLYITRCVIKTRKRQLIRGLYEELSLVLAWVLSMVQGAVLLRAAANGFATREVVDTDSALKLYLASQILAVASIAFSKIAIIVFIIWSMRPTGSHRIFAWTTLGASFVYMAVGIFGTAFQCSTPDTWDVTAGTCSSQVNIISAIAALNVISDMLIIILPFPIVFKVQFTDKSATKSRVIILSVFLARLFPIALTLGFTVTYNKDHDSSDAVWTDATPQLWAQGVVYLNLVVSSLPAMFSFLKFMASGAMGVRLGDEMHKKSLTTSPLKNLSRSLHLRSSKMNTATHGSVTMESTPMSPIGGHDPMPEDGIKVMTEVQIDSVSLRGDSNSNSSEKMFG